jgi:hypothetical protein
MPDTMNTVCNPSRENSLIHFRDCLFAIEDIKTAMIFFAAGAKILFEVKFIALIIYTGRKDLFFIIERSPHSQSGVVLLKCQPLKKIEMMRRKWKSDFLINAVIGDHRTTVGYLVAGDHGKNRLNRSDDAMIWENLIALASIVFVNQLKQE